MRFPMCPVWMLVLSLMWLQGAVAAFVGGKELINLNRGLPEGYYGQLEYRSGYYYWNTANRLDEYLIRGQRADNSLALSLTIVLRNLGQITTTPKRIQLQFDNVVYHVCFSLKHKDSEILAGPCDDKGKIVELVSFRSPINMVEFVFFPNKRIIANAAKEVWRNSDLVTYTTAPQRTGDNAYHVSMSSLDSLDMDVRFSPGFIATTNYAVATTTVAPTAAAPTFRSATAVKLFDAPIVTTVRARTIRPPAPRSKNRRNCAAAVGLFTVWPVLLLILVEF